MRFKHNINSTLLGDSSNNSGCSDANLPTVIGFKQLTMEHIRRTLLVLYLLFTRLYADLFNLTEFNAFVEMSDLKESCPYSQFCGQNASARFLQTDKYRSCCQSCSCDPECGFRLNCCSSQLDNYRTGVNAMICRHLLAVEPVTSKYSVKRVVETAPHYRIVTTCSSSDVTIQTTRIDCEQNSSDIERSFLPVFSPTTKYIYIDSYCALCNNISDTLPMRRAIACLSRAEESLSELMNYFDRGEVSNDYSGCLSYYIPPAYILDTVSCYPNVIRKCNTTGMIKMRDHTWDFCKMFNATFISQTPVGHFQAYANVYCFLCNIRSMYKTSKIKKMICTKPGNGYLKLGPTNIGLTVILDTTSMDKNSASGNETETVGNPQSAQDEENNCPPKSIMIASFKRMCRPLKCPKGKLLINNRCDYYSRQWIGGPFAVMLRLSPLRNNTYLHSSFITDMSMENKKDSRVEWIKRNTLKRWKFLVLYHLSKNQSFVEYIVVQAKYPSNSIDPHVLNRYIKKALEDIWEINYLGSTFSFKLEIYEHVEYTVIDKDKLLFAGINTNHNYGLLPNRLYCTGLTSKDNSHYEFMLFPLSEFQLNKLNEGMFVAKLFFCSQIDLLPDEYHYTMCNTIFFKVKNTTIYTFSTITWLGDKRDNYDFSTHSRNVDRHAVRVCIYEFEQNASIAAVTSLHVLGIYTVIFHTMN